MARRRRNRDGQAQKPGDPAWQPPAELCERVRAMARRWSLDRPDLREDLEQEGLLAIWMKGMTDAPLNYQMQTAKHRMLSVRKLGRSVDGKLDATYKRARTYIVYSMERKAILVGDNSLSLKDLLPSAFRVEEHIVSKLTLLELLSVLEPAELECVTLLCLGYTLREVAAETVCDIASVRLCVEGAQTKLRPLLLGYAQAA